MKSELYEFISRSSFYSMLGDCFEVVMRAVKGQVVEINIEEEPSWRDGTEQECLESAEIAFNHVAKSAIELLSSSKAIEDIMGADYITGERFQDYVGRYTDQLRDGQEKFEAKKTACEFELELDTEDRYGEK